MRSLAAVIAALIAFAQGSAAADLTGSWTGGYQSYSQCDGTPKTSQGPAALYLTQSGAFVTGLGTVFVSMVDCEQLDRQFAFTVDVQGSASGDAFTLVGFFPVVGFVNVAGTVSGNSLTFRIKGGDTVIAGSLTRASAEIPASTLTGSYSGTYSAIDDVSEYCSNISTISYSGSLTGSFVQAGKAIRGEVMPTGMKDARPNEQRICTVVDDEPVLIIFSGSIEGNEITGLVWDEDPESPEPFFAAISGTTIAGMAGEQGDEGHFTLSRTSTTPAPLVLDFDASPDHIQPGGSASLSWIVKHATSVWIDSRVGLRPAVGSVAVSPPVTTTYTLTAKGEGGTATATETVTVVAAPAIVILSDHPEGMLQRANEAGATDSYTLTNVGGAETAITLSQTGSFFTQSPASFTLKAGASQTVTLTALAQPAGVHEGSSAVSGQGVKPGLAIRVILLSAGSPSGPVDPHPEERRKHLSAPAGEDPAGAVSFTNRGTGTVEAIAVSNVEWLVPQGGRFTIAPGATTSIPFTIRRSLRPDGASPIGAVTGRFGLLFFGAPFAASGKTAAATVPVSKSLVTVVDVVKPGTAASSPPPLAPGELALFVAGMSSNAGSTGDLLLANGADGTISDLKIYYAATGGSPSFLSGSISNLVANSGVAFPGLVKNVFGKDSQTGTVQLRSSTIAEIAVSATETNTSTEGAPVVTALPLFRSDRGADAGEEMSLVGVEQSAAATTALLIQEMTGSAATVQIDAFDAAGASVGTARTASVGGFGLLELTDAVPSGAVSVRIRNTSSNSARIDAAAMVTDAVSGDVWAIVDSMFGLPLDEPVFVPLLAGLQRVPGAETELLFLNGGTATAAVSLERHTTHPRKRPIPARGSGGAGSLAAITASQDLSVAPNQTVTSSSTDGTAGYAVITAGSSVRSIGLMEFASTTGSGRMGSSLPAVPGSSALGLGEAIRFPGVEDASDATAAAQTPVTYSSDLVLVETAGGEAGVRVTVRTTAVVSTTLTSQIVSALDVTLAANRFYVIRDVVGTVFGAQRSRYGDLTNVTLDVEVTSGTGRVIAFLQSIDNASRDVVVRTR